MNKDFNNPFLQLLAGIAVLAYIFWMITNGGGGTL